MTITPKTDENLLRRHRYSATFFFLSCLFFLLPLKQLMLFAFTHDYGSHIFIVVPVSALLIYAKRSEIFSHARYDILPGVCLGVIAIVPAVTALVRPIAEADRLALEILSLTSLWISAFILCYGRSALRAGLFPLLFLLLLVPIPDVVIDKVIHFLQAGSALAAFWLCRVLHVPVLKQGLILSIPTLDIEVARECSGIRSSMVLLVTTLLVGEFVLASFWRKSLFVLSVIPIMIAKNGLRIVAIALLSVYVSRRFLHGWLHQSGGVVFYLLGLLALLPILSLLKKGEKGTKPAFSTSLFSEVHFRADSKVNEL